jgi:ABC-type transport system involved in multi-copper enzyme maturation permease subunit
LAVSVAVGFGRLRDPVQLWMIFAVLVLLASFGYGAVFSLLGALFHRRAMVVAVTYSIFSEFVLTNIPGAVIVKQFTFSFHFKNLLFAWRDFNLPTTDFNEIFLDSAPPIQHLAIMIALTVTLLFCANFAVTHREYITADES